MRTAIRNAVGHCVRICVDKPQYVYCLKIPDDVMGIVDTVTTCY